MRYILIIITFVVTLIPFSELRAQHTIGVAAGSGIGYFRPYPSQETRTVTGLHSGGISWRYYTAERYVGAIGIDVEFFQRGYSFAPFAYAADEGSEYSYYTRRYNSIMVPIIWQPYVYMFRNHVRVFLDAAATFCYNTGGTYDNDAFEEYNMGGVYEGDYEMKTARDNRWGYGLMGGIGIAYIAGRFEIMARGRYYFGYSDILKNRNKYYNGSNDGAENPFTYYTPTRSPIDNITVNFGINYRLGKGDGFDSWKVKPPKKLEMGTDFNYQRNEEDSKSSKSNKNSQNSQNNNRHR